MQFDPSIHGLTPVLFNEKPEGFYNPSKYCTDENWLGTLYSSTHEKLSWNIRNKYYPKIGKEHICRTPLYAIRYAIDTYTQPGDTVLDPFMGSGTTGVESLLKGRKTVGCELEFSHVTIPTLTQFDPSMENWKLFVGDSEEQLDNIANDSCQLLNLSNPYFGDSDTPMPGKGQTAIKYHNEKSTRKISRPDYWRKMEAIQTKACDKLKIGGHAIFVIKDLMKNKEIDPLHEQLADLMPNNMEFVGTIALPHYPSTLFMNTYKMKYGVRPPMEQICPIFKKIG